MKGMGRGRMVSGSSLSELELDEEGSLSGTFVLDVLECRIRMTGMSSSVDITLVR
jgi:hypothetical protein